MLRMRAAFPAGVLTAVLLAAGVWGVATAQAQPTTGSMRVGAYASRHAGDTFMTITVVAVVPATMKPTAATMSVLDARGTSLQQWKAPASALRKSALTTTFLLPAGRYTVRATITEGAKRPVTADAVVVAAITPVAGGLSVSEITFGTTDTPFCPQPALSTTSTGTARFELYGGKMGMSVSIVAELANDSGAVLQKLTPTVTGTPEPDRFIVNLPLDVRTLAPGPYIVRATIGIDGQPTTTVEGRLQVGSEKQ